MLSELGGYLLRGNVLVRQGIAVIPGCAKGADPESILTMVVMDSGFAALRRPGMTGELLFTPGML